MTENGWQVVGRLAKARRERLGLKQNELALYGGPAVATVGKFERAAQEGFPTRTQHQIENALGWTRTTIEQVVDSIEDGSLSAEDWEYDLVHESVPDLSRPEAAYADRTLDDAMDAIRSVMRLVDPPRIDEATRSAVLAVVRYVDAQGVTQLRVVDPTGGDGDADDAGGAAPMNEAAHDDPENPPGDPED